MRICKCGVKYSAKQYGDNCPICPAKNKVWEILDIPVGTILVDGFVNNIRWIVMRGMFSLCAYVGIPEDHPLADCDYDDISLDCHGGLTFSGAGDGKIRPTGYYWYGWDYNHYGDAATYYYDEKLEDIFKKHLSFYEDKKWTIKAVTNEAHSVASWEFKKFVELAEKISIREKERRHLSVTQLFLTVIFPRYFK